MDIDPESLLQQSMPLAVVIGIEALRREGWTTQIPYRLDIAVECESAEFQDERFVIQLRTAAWFNAISPYLKGDRTLGIPWLSPAWALADMLHEHGWGNFGLWPDDIEWGEITPADEAAWKEAYELFTLPTPDLLSMRIDPRGHTA